MELLTVNEVAKRLRVDASTVRRWIRDGLLEAVTLPHNGHRKQHRIRKDVFEKLLGSQQSEAFSYSNNVVPLRYVR